MAKTLISHACGHDVTHNLIGPVASREVRAEWLAARPCYDCRRDAAISASKAEGEAAIAKLGADVVLPTLTGTEKQVAWAEQIRAKAVVATGGWLKALNQRALGRITAAKWFCDKSRCSPSECARAALGQWVADDARRAGDAIGTAAADVAFDLVCEKIEAGKDPDFADILDGVKFLVERLPAALYSAGGSITREAVVLSAAEAGAAAWAAARERLRERLAEIGLDDIVLPTESGEVTDEEREAAKIRADRAAKFAAEEKARTDAADAERRRWAARKAVALELARIFRAAGQSEDNIRALEVNLWQQSDAAPERRLYIGFGYRRDVLTFFATGNRHNPPGSLDCTSKALGAQRADILALCKSICALWPKTQKFELGLALAWDGEARKTLPDYTAPAAEATL